MRTLLLVACLALAPVEPACAQAASLLPGTANAAAASAPAATPAAPKPPQPVALAAVALEAENVQARLHDLHAQLADDDTLAATEDDLRVLASTTDNRIQEVRRLEAGRPSLGTLRGLQTGWDTLKKRAQGLMRDLTRRAADADRDLATVEQLGATWQATAQAAGQQSAPPAVLGQISAVQSSIAKTDEALQAQRARILALQAKAADLVERATQTEESLAAASRRAAGRLLQRDGAPVFRASYWSGVQAALGAQGIQTAQAQWASLSTFVATHHAAIAVHGVAFMLILAALLAARPKVKTWSDEEPDFRRAGRALEAPVSMAVVLALLLGHLFYEQEPLVVGEVFGIVAVVPMLVVLRRLIEPSLHPILYVLLGFYSVDRLRGLTAPAPALARLILWFELSVALCVLARTFRVARRTPSAPAPGPPWLRAAGTVAFVVAACAWLAESLGLADLADLLGTSEITGAYLALVLYALLVIAAGVLLGLSHVPPVAFLSMVRSHRHLLVRRGVRLLAWGAALFWAIDIAKMLGIWSEVFAAGGAVLDASVSIGSISLVVGRVLGFFLAIVAALWVARFVNFALEEEVYPKVHMERGLPYVISTVLRYMVLFAGFVIGLGALGIDMTKFTILAGAFSVGLGFGLQNIVNNFVSGLIVLFERPVKIGDVVQFGDVLGQVERIGIRASVIRAYNGAEVIIPNGTLIANNLTNWTFSNKTRRVDVPIPAALGSDADQVKLIMLEAARSHPGVATSPPPQALLTQIGPDALQFELHVWCDAIGDWNQVRSDLASNIEAALKSHGISFK